MPMPPGGEILGLAHEAIRPPRHQMSRARDNSVATARADIILDRGCRRDRLHIPEPVPLGLGVPSAEQCAAQVNRSIF